MKKIFALLLVIATVLALASCNINKKGPENTTDGSATIEDYNAAIARTAPETVKINTTYENNSPEITLTGEYNVTYNADGTATIVYAYDRLNNIGDSEMKTRVSGTATVLADGTVSGDIDSMVSASAAKAIVLDASKLTYDISMGVLNATVKAENTKDVFGVDLGSDAMLLMRITGEGDAMEIGSYTVNYTTSSGKVGIVCIFN